MKKRQVVIIGAGAAGMTAAIMAARNGAAVTVLEQNEKPGKKICATGNGKCNFSNLAMPEDAYRGRHPEFVKDAFERFSVSSSINWPAFSIARIREPELYLFGGVVSPSFMKNLSTCR